jgi:hypothetical protein
VARDIGALAPEGVHASARVGIFLRAHYRPHLLVIDLETPSGSLRGKRLFAFVHELVRRMETNADYALCCEGQEVKVAFESDLDAKTLGKLLMARVVERGGEDWASKSICDLNWKLKTVRRSRGRQRQPPTLH